MGYNPLRILVIFADGSKPTARTYTSGASNAVEDMAKAIQWYTAKETPCRISLYDFRGALIISEVIGEMPPT